MSKTSWQFIAILSISLMVLTICVIVWLGLAFWSNIKAISSSQLVCLAGRSQLDSIAAATMVGRLDVVSFALTMLGVFIAIFAVAGFWMIRRDVLDQVERIAADEARRYVQELYADKDKRDGNKGGKPGVLDYIKGNVERLWRRNEVVKFDPSAVSLEGAVEEKGGSGEKS